jgi:hypothetical protein
MLAEDPVGRVADSAQFSAAVSELAPIGTSGSALSLQLATGFILTGVTILGIGLLDPRDGTTWRLAFWLPRPRSGRRNRRDVAPPRAPGCREDGGRQPMNTGGRRRRRKGGRARAPVG